MAKKVYLIRHGETEWSLSGQHTGLTDIPLTPQGENRARHLSELFRKTKIDHVLTSPLARARLTCELAGFGALAHIQPQLAEWDYGEYEGRTLDEIHAERSGWNVFRNGAPGGESPDQVSERADAVVAQLRVMDGTAALFSHGHFLRALVVRWIGLPISEGRRFALATASVSILGYDRQDPEAPTIMLWNAVSNELFELSPRLSGDHPTG
jgi:broad specificity phosphatase PhoE